MLKRFSQKNNRHAIMEKNVLLHNLSKKQSFFCETFVDNIKTIKIK